jgi:predicted ribonuclease YlaK
MFIRYPDKLENWDLAQLLHAGEGPVHILVPILVVDELDRLKESRDKEFRWRAGYTLAVLNRLVGAATGAAVLKAADRTALEHATGGPLGVVTVEIVLDPPGHVRLPLDDDEIIDRAVASAGLAARPITLITYDTGQSMRARHAGLDAIKLPGEVESEEARRKA